MTIELLIAPPATGKTETCIQRIKDIQADNPMSKVWVLVPDRQNVAYFRWRLAQSGGGMGIAIGTFRDLYKEILEKNGIFLPVITPALEHRLVQEAVDEAAKENELAHYLAIKNKPGFILALQDCFSELRSGLVNPDQFLDYTQATFPARRELALLYNRFALRLQQLNWIDRDGLSWMAVSTLESNPKAAGEIRMVVVDGFTSFMGARRKFLKLLANQVGEMLITLPGLQNSDCQVHRRSEQEIETLKLDLPLKLTTINAPPRLSPEILHLEQYVLNQGESDQINSFEPILIEARSQSEEAREALRWIKGLNKRKNLSLNKCAVFVSSLETYRPLLHTAAKEFGIKVHFTHPEPLAESPAILALLTLLSLPEDGYPTRTLLNTLRSPYLDFGLDARMLEDLEKVSQQALIVMGKNQWDEAWNMLEKATPAVFNELDEERQREDITAGIDLPALRDAFSNFWQTFNAIQGTRSQTEWITWLEFLLENLHFYERISGERDQQACQSLGEALKALIVSESVAGIRSTDYAQFLSDLQGALNGAVLDEPLESKRDALLIGEIYEARATRFQAVALLGFSEGLFPKVENSDPFLDENLRRDLGLESKLQREQASIFYQAFTRSDQHLFITRPYLSESGEAWEASPFWIAVQQLFSKNSLQKKNPSEARLQADAASTQELLFWGMHQNYLAYPKDAELSSRWQELEKASQILNARRSKKARGPYEGYLDQTAGQLSKQYSSEYLWSASRLEDYGTCPYKFYISNTLKLAAKIQPELGLNAAQLGSIFHRILELVYKKANSFEDTQSILDSLADTAASVFLDAPIKYGFRPSPLWEVEKDQFVETLRQTIEALEEESQDWLPLKFEQKFGVDEQTILKIDLGQEFINLKGTIDRVDKNSSGEIRVLDYKTGGTNLDKIDFINGRRLQLPIYGLATEEALGLGKVVDGFYWKIREAKASSFKLSTFESNDVEGAEAAYHLVISHLLRIVNGIRSGEFPPRPPRGGCPDYCPAVQWCWRYQAGF